MKTIANSKEEKAIIKLKGNKPIKKYINPDVIILNINPLNILSNICPESILAANLNPNDMFLAKYDKNSINTKAGNKARGHPAGTNNEKNLMLCSTKPNIVTPNTIVKLNAKVKTK
jgi:hypothetical protein